MDQLKTNKTIWRAPTTVTHTTIRGLVTDEAHPGKCVELTVQCLDDRGSDHTRYSFEAVGPHKLWVRSGWSFADPEDAKYAAQTIAVPLLSLALELEERGLVV